MDVAEQALTALEMLSRRHGKAILQCVCRCVLQHTSLNWSGESSFSLLMTMTAALQKQFLSRYFKIYFGFDFVGRHACMSNLFGFLFYNSSGNFI